MRAQPITIAAHATSFDLVAAHGSYVKQMVIGTLLASHRRW